MSKTVTLTIKGMHCNGCALGTQGALEKIPQVKSADVSFPNNSAVVQWDGDAVDESALREAVKSAGFEVESIQ